MNIIELSYLTMFYACERFNCHKCLPCRGVWRIRRKFRIYENWMEFSSYPDPPHALLAYFCFSSFLFLLSLLPVSRARSLSPSLPLFLLFPPLSPPPLYSFAFIYFAPATNLLPPVSAFVPHSLYFSSSPTHSAQLSSNIQKLFESLPISLSCAKLTWEKFVPFIELFLFVPRFSYAAACHPTEINCIALY